MTQMLEQASAYLDRPDESQGSAWIDEINKLQAKRGKPPLSADDVIVRYMRMTGTEVMSHFIKFERADLEKMAPQVPGMALLIGHDYSSAPIGTFFKAWVVDEGEHSYLDALFYTLNNDEGKALAQKIDSGIYNEASITWTYDKAICSICGGDYTGEKPNADGEYCQHFRGYEYDGQVCYVHSTGNVEIHEASIVYAGAHPNTRVGLAEAASKVGLMILESAEKAKKASLTKNAESASGEIVGKKEGEAKAMGEEKEKAYVPRNPDDYSLDEDPSWERPILRDFLSELGMSLDTKWEDIPATQRRWIMRHFAWAPSSDPEEVSFSDLKLPHHLPGAYPKSILKWGGVRAAAQRLPTANIPVAEADEVKAHLGAHYKEFDRVPPWERDDSAWKRYEEVMQTLGKGYVDEDLLKEASELTKKLFGEEEYMELSVKIGEETFEFKGEAKSVAEQIREAMTSLYEKFNKEAAELKKQIEEFSREKEELEKLAELGKAYVNDLVDEVKRLFVASEGADALAGYEKMVMAMAERGEVEALKAERDRLQRKVGEAFPERISKDADEGPLLSEQPIDVEAFKQR